METEIRDVSQCKFLKEDATEEEHQKTLIKADRQDDNEIVEISWRFPLFGNCSSSATKG